MVNCWGKLIRKTESAGISSFWPTIAIGQSTARINQLFNFDLRASLEKLLHIILNGLDHFRIEQCTGIPQIVRISLSDLSQYSPHDLT